MPWSVGAGPLRYSEPAGSKSVLRGPLLVLSGFAAVALILVIVALYPVAIAGAWLCGLLVGYFRGDPAGYSSRYAQAVIAWGRDLTGM